VARLSAIFYALALTFAQQESFNNNLHLALISFLALGRVARRAFIARAPTSAPFPSNDKKYQLTHVVVTGACVLAQGGRPSTTLLWAGLLLTSASVGGNSSLCSCVPVLDVGLVLMLFQEWRVCLACRAIMMALQVLTVLRAVR